MVKFKVGDRVRRIACDNADSAGRRLTVGSVYTVTGVASSGWVCFANFGGPSNPKCFELVGAAPSPGAHVSSRSNDPATSKAAGKVKRVSLRQRVLGAITEAGAVGANGHEICGRGNDMLNSVTPRLAELRREGKIKDSGQRRDKQIVWVLA